MRVNQRFYPVAAKLSGAEQLLDGLAWYDPCDLCGLCDGAIQDNNYEELLGEILHPQCAKSLGRGVIEYSKPAPALVILRKKGDNENK